MNSIYRHFLCCMCAFVMTILPAYGAGTLAAGGWSSYAIDSDGRMVAWGWDSDGQLGLGRPFALPRLTLVTDNFQAQSSTATQRKIASGFNHILAIKPDNTLWVWGGNDSGQVGIGSTTPTSKPILLGSGYLAVAAGSHHSLALRTDGSLWAWGGNEYGQLGVGDTSNRLVPVQIPGKYQAIFGGGVQSFAIDSEGKLWGWGRNDDGAVGDGTQTNALRPVVIPFGTGFTTISTGSLYSPTAHTVGLKADGSLWGWGSNAYGQLMDSKVPNILTPVQLGQGFKYVAAGYGRTATITAANGALNIRGLNDYGQLGDGTFVNRSSPYTIGVGFSQVALGNTSTYALKEDGALYSWGMNWYGQLANGTFQYTITPAQVDSGVMEIASGFLHGVARKADLRLYTWGSNPDGRLGDGSLIQSPSPILVGNGFSKIAASTNYFALALKSDGSLLSAGTNDQGQLGLGDGVKRSIFTLIGTGFTDMAAGDYHGLAVKQDETLWAWGLNPQGQLGNGGTDQQNKPIQIGQGFKAVAAGANFSLGLKTDGTLWVWGENTHGLGPNLTSSLRPTQIAANISSIAAGESAAYAIDQNGRCLAWGNNYYGQIGNGSQQDTGIPVVVATNCKAITAGRWHALAVQNDGTLLAWGLNNMGQLGSSNSWMYLKPTSILKRVKNVAAGLEFSLVMFDDGTMASMGANGYGQLGNGTQAQNFGVTNVVDINGMGLLDVLPEVPNDPTNVLLPYFLIAQQNGNELNAILSDKRAEGLQGDVYFTALLPSNSSLLSPPVNQFADGSAAIIPVVLGRGGVKQTGPSLPASPTFSGGLTSSNQFAVYSGAKTDPLANTNAIICMGVTLPALSAKGQVLMRPIATGTSLAGVTQCPTVQTAATTELYRASSSGTISNLALKATITPQPEDRGQVRNVYSWAIAPNGQQYMQTTNGWALMSEPMQPAATITVPTAGDVSLTVLNGGFDLTSLKGTLVYVGMGSSWQEVKQLNKAGHYYTLQ